MVLHGARALTPWGWVDDAAVLVDDGLIVDVRPWRSLSGAMQARHGTAATRYATLAPGFVDAQVNGIDDVDVAVAAGDDWDALDRALLAQGVTSWCPTLVSMPLDAVDAALVRIAAAASRPGRDRPTIVGAHLEGPFLGARLGAHRPEMVRAIDPAWIGALPRHVVLMTIGPEQPGAADAIAALVARGVTVALGHTEASDAQLEAAAAAGATAVTHLFNAMTGLDHRRPGVAAWVLNHPAIIASLIADGVHVHPTMLRLAAAVLGPGRWMLVTDSVAWRRTGRDGRLRLELREGAPRLADGTLAGSAVTMDAAVRTCVAAGIDMAAALSAASTVPARLLGLRDRGVLAAGARADVVALGEELTVEAVWVAGRKVVGDGAPPQGGSDRARR